MNDYLSFIYLFINCNELLYNEGPACKSPTKEPMELAVVSNFHHWKPHGGSNSGLNPSAVVPLFLLDKNKHTLKYQHQRMKQVDSTVGIVWWMPPYLVPRSLGMYPMWSGTVRVRSSFGPCQMPSGFEFSLFLHRWQRSHGMAVCFGVNENVNESDIKDKGR